VQALVSWCPAKDAERMKTSRMGSVPRSKAR